jgi:hypothetical protein
MDKPSNLTDAASPQEELPWLRLVQAHVNSLRYGVVQVVVHEARVVQIEITERLRLDRLDTTPLSRTTRSLESTTHHDNEATTDRTPGGSRNRTHPTP